MPNSLLCTNEPHPVEIIRPFADSPFLLTVEHAGNLVPQRLGRLGLSEADLNRHIAWDVGIAQTARIVSEILQAPLFLQRYSRLVVDCNRRPHADDYITPFSEDTDIPGNLDPQDADIAARTDEIYQPYHNAITHYIDKRCHQGAKKAHYPLLLASLHSCTANYLGFDRPWDVGILYAHDRILAPQCLSILRHDPQLTVGDNQPYKANPNLETTIALHGDERGIPNVEFEIRNDHLRSDMNREIWARRIADVLQEAAAAIL